VVRFRPWAPAKRIEVTSEFQHQRVGGSDGSAPKPDIDRTYRPLPAVDHQVGLGPQFYQSVCKLGLEGVVSKRLDAPYVPGNRGLWLKTKCLNREEFVVVGWTDREGARPRLGALLLAYDDPDGRLTYAGRAGTGMSKELERMWRRLQPLATSRMPLDVAPPRTSRFGTPLELSRVHWVRPELVVEANYSTWTLDNLLRQVAYVGFDVQRPVPHPKTRV
jgi:ATP-dependent DNA ligase